MMRSCKELNVIIVLATIYMMEERSPGEAEEEEHCTRTRFKGSVWSKGIFFRIPIFC